MWRMEKIIYHNKPTIGVEEVKAISDALSSLNLTTGAIVQKFESTFSKYINLEAVATSSGTSALHLALIALGISKNDEVIIPSYTCIAIAQPILYQQAKPILVDVNDDYNMSVEDIKKKINKKTRAIIAPHMFGWPVDLNEIKKVCKKNNVYLIEDCAQSIGATYHNKMVGTIGDISIFSFYATKMMTTVQGGMVCTNNKDWIKIIKDIRYHDQCRSNLDTDLRIKYSYMMSDVGASIGIVQLKKINDFINRRRIIASVYRDKLDNKLIRHPLEYDGKGHVYSRYVIRTPCPPQKLINKLSEHNIICERMYIPPLHKRTLLKRFNNMSQFLHTDNIINSAISLPIYPTLTDKEVDYIADVVNKTVGGL